MNVSFSCFRYNLVQPGLYHHSFFSVFAGIRQIVFAQQMISEEVIALLHLFPQLQKGGGPSCKEEGGTMQTARTDDSMLRTLYKNLEKHGMSSNVAVITEAVRKLSKGVLVAMVNMQKK